jgi:hypothetical protein
MSIINWDVDRWDIHMALNNLKDYVALMEIQLQQVREAARAKIPQNPAGLSNEDFSQWQREIFSHESRFEKDFPVKARYSFIVLLSIIIENSIRDICDVISERRSFFLKEKDFKGAPLDRLKTYLIKVAQVALPDKMLLQELNDIQNVRNCIIHTNGYVELSRDKKRLTQLARDAKGIDIDADGYVVISLEYCNRSIQATAIVFDQIFESAGFGALWPSFEK